MVVVAQNTSNLTIRSILHAEKLTGPNLTNWYRNLRIVLMSENKLAHLEQPLIHLHVPIASQVARDAYDALFDAQSEVACLMLGTRKPFPHQVERDKDLLGLIHLDVCGPFRTMSKEGASYFITFNDDFSYYGYVYLMKHTHKVFETIKVFQNEVENQLGKKIKAIRSDRGGEYLRHDFVNHMKSYGIVSQLTPPYTPQHNEVSGRIPFWGYALESAARILNMVPTKKIDRTLYEIWNGKAPKLSYLKVWGCEAHVKRYTPDKLDSSSIKCIFIRYPKETMGYYFYNLLENKIYVGQNVEFFENNITLEEASGSHGMLEASRSDVGLELI
ncbi:retrotransposon protein, putative, ty1-copia subclass [Tanacetum coccineum]